MPAIPDICMMNWNNIFDQIPDVILSRGEKYYHNNAVYNLEETDTGCWEALVEGTDSYEVVVGIGEGELGFVDCNCPYDGEICKHVVAVLYAVKARQGNPVRRKKTAAAAADPEVKELLQHTGSKELAAFIAGYAAKDAAFKKAILAYFNTTEADNPDTFRKQAEACFRGNGRDYYAAAYAAAKKLSVLADKAAYMYRTGNYRSAAMLAQSIAASIPRNYGSVDDSNGSVGGVFEDAIELIRDIGTDNQVAPELKQSLVQWLKKETLDPIYDDYGFSSIHSLVIPLMVSAGMTAEALSYADEQIRHAGSDYELTRALTRKYDLLREAGRQEEANDLAQAHIRLPEFRESIVAQRMDQKEYGAAIVLVQEGIAIAEAQRHPGTANRWRDLLLELYEAAGDDNACIALAEKMFCAGRNIMPYYRLLKRKTPPDGWKDYLGNLIATLNANNIWGHYDIAQIQIEEQDWQSLWDAMRNERLDQLDQYEKYLGPHFPEQLRDKYARDIETYAAEHTGRDHYRKINRWIRKLHTYPGGDIVAGRLLADFRVRYKARRAMMEELGL